MTRGVVARAPLPLATGWDASGIQGIRDGWLMSLDRSRGTLDDCLGTLSDCLVGQYHQLGTLPDTLGGQCDRRGLLPD